ncbi:MAG: sugar phosphate isomerase/epimerase, partial [Thermomicrobiales bacterium]|nr:sugar phosphate isomerase/epimerase [Thermomicrobiales bacterium]
VAGPAFDVVAQAAAVRRASEAANLPVAAICTHPTHDPLVPDPTERARRFAGLARLLATADELGAGGVVSVPLRPPHVFAPDDPGNLHDLAVREFAAWADALPNGSAAVFLEPLNRYEASFLNRVGQAAAICRAVDNPRLRALADLFHMNIEESDLAAPLREAGDCLGHVHVADNNRFEPGAGCLDFAAPFAALRAIGYRGFISIECWPARGPALSRSAETALPAAVAHLRSAWNAAALPTATPAKEVMR